MNDPDEPTRIELPAEDLAEMQMAAEMYAASPDGQTEVREFLDGLPKGTIEITGNWGAEDE